MSWKQKEIIGNATLYLGDCVEILPLLDAANSMITDPPYGVDYAGKNEFLNLYDKGNRIQDDIVGDKIEDYLSFSVGFLEKVNLTKYNTVYIFSAGQNLHNIRLAFDTTGFTWSDYLIWVKNRHVLGRKDHHAQHEFIVYGWKGRHKFYGGFRTTILKYKGPFKSKLHPTMKPIKLLDQLVKEGSQPNDTIIDPFMGSGTTGVACINNDRKFIGIEIEPKYFDVACKQIEKAKQAATIKHEFFEVI